MFGGEPEEDDKKAASITGEAPEISVSAGMAPVASREDDVFSISGGASIDV